ncbi:hypothetical protein POJ06DRAFT_262477 [Lipomyces tetrasporus]|uniref:Uncharacterized protein n=1 Tax=Lipomyces tetrasporus TaxID=54092 RepID=A0AAD7VPF6_9ASCO|nr:uncharacterized protein POJ06DRAFT_262477 [Lipomyces tetrasporus]KAJ8097088.1 hypothetical protein POJ06DRAFT_262477 [Lipomyces tetrasporus]
MACVDDEEASYQRALNFLKDNEPERRLDIRLSYQSFRALEAQAHARYGDAKYPRVEYSGPDSRVTIYTVPTELHGTSATALQTAISYSVRDGLLRRNKQELLRRIIPIGESTISSLDDLGQGSTKTPDGGIRYIDSSTGRRELTLIIETGVSERYQQLRADINVWLSDIHCRTAILLWFKESPSFTNPTDVNSYSVNDRPAFDHAVQQALRDHPLGPYRYRDHDWCGTVAEAFIEIFKSDASNEVPARYPIAENGLIVVEGQSLDIGLILGDLFPLDDEAVGNARTERIRLDMGFVQSALLSATSGTAETRFNRFLGAH